MPRTKVSIKDDLELIAESAEAHHLYTRAANKHLRLNLYWNLISIV